MLYKYFSIIRTGLEIELYNFATIFGMPRKKYEGNNIKEITTNIVKDRYDGLAFEAGNRFKQFWIRDFAIFSKEINDLGFHIECRNTLEWAIGRFKHDGHVSTTIYKGGACDDIFYYAADSLPLLLYAIDQTDNRDLVNKNLGFFNAEVEDFYNRVFDPERSLAKKDEFFGSPKDAVIRKNTATASIFTAMLKNILHKFPQLKNPFKKYDIASAIIKEFWTGEYFVNDRQDDEAFFASDPNVLAYWTGVITNKEMNYSSIKEIKKRKLDSIYPLAYHEKVTDKFMPFFVRLMSPDYQGNSIWLFLSGLYINQQLEFKEFREEAAEQFKKIRKLILKDKTYYEV